MSIRYRIVFLFTGVLWVFALLVNLFFTKVTPFFLIAVLINLAIILTGLKFLYKFYGDNEITMGELPSLPASFDPAQVGYVMDGYADDQDIISLFIFWGNEGYLRMIYASDEIFFSRKRKIEKAKPFYQRELFARLFRHDVRVQLSGLSQKFFTEIGMGKKTIEDFFNITENHVYYLESLVMQRLLSVLITIPLVLCLIPTYVIQMEPGLTEIFAILFVSTLISISAIYPVRTFIHMMYHWHSLNTSKKVSKISLLLIYVFGFTGFIVAYTFNTLPHLTIFSVVTILVMVMMTASCRRLTPKGKEWQSQMLNLKSFIKNASMEAIINLSAEDPHYYYEVLPYAYVMGVSNEWTERFFEAGINPLPCPWFEDKCKEHKNIKEFHEQLMLALHEITNVLTSRPPIKQK